MKLVLVQPRLAYDADADNAGTVARLLEPLAGTLVADDVVLLPEHYDLRSARSEYLASVQGLARRLGCHVVGGSHHEERGDARVNAGVVADASGSIVGQYEKLRPYAEERARVRGGTELGELTIGGRAVLVLICADFWFSDVFARCRALPDLVLVPALSVTRKPTPDYSRALWQHLAIARAYEFGTYVGISDWAHTPAPVGLSASGVAGFADPTAIEPEAMFRRIDDSAGVLVHDLDFDALGAFRRDRMIRGFFWKHPS